MASRQDSTARKQQERQALSFPVARPKATEETTGDTVQVADGILQARIPMPMALAHINVYLLRDDDGWWLIDTGLDTQASKHCWQRIAANDKALEGLPFKGVICTHFHHDHTGTANWLTEQFNIPLYMSHGEYLMLRVLARSGDRGFSQAQIDFYRAGGVPDEQIAELKEVLGGDYMPLRCPESYHRLRDGQWLTIGGREWQVIIGEGHAPEHVCLYSAADKLLVAGDQILPEISPNIMVGHIEPDADPLSNWFASLDRLDELDADTVVMPSHGDVFLNLHQRVAQLREHHERQFDNLRSWVKSNNRFTAFEAMRELFPQNLESVQLMLALGETLAHLTWLRRHGEFEREFSDGVFWYSGRGK